MGHVNIKMSCQPVFNTVSFAAYVAIERLFPSVRLHVYLQLTRRCAGVVALIALEWLLLCVLSHHVIFQLTSLNAGILAHCASVSLFTRVGLFVPLQMA